MRISDWSSDVCSSDLLALVGAAGQDVKKAKQMGDAWRHWTARTSYLPFARQFGGAAPWGDTIPRGHALWGGIVVWLIATWAQDRKSVVSGKSVSVRVGLGGSRYIKKKKHRQKS